MAETGRVDDMSNTLPGMPEGENLPPRFQDNRVPERPLTRAAHNAGSALGTTVNRVRTRLTVVRGRGGSAAEELSAKARQYSETTTRKLEDLKLDAQARGERLAETVQQRSADLGRDVRQRIRTLRAESQRVQRDYPIQVILGCAAAAFALGFVLRIWRSARD